MSTDSTAVRLDPVPLVFRDEHLPPFTKLVWWALYGLAKAEDVDFRFSLDQVAALVGAEAAQVRIAVYRLDGSGFLDLLETPVRRFQPEPYVAQLLSADRRRVSEETR